MKRFLAAFLLIVSTQLSVWAGPHRVIVQVAPNAQARAIAGAVGGQVLQAIPGTNFYLMSVPSAASLAAASQLGVVAVENNAPIAVQPSGAIAIVQSSQGAEWYAAQPAMQLVHAARAAAVSSGRGIVIADINARIDYGHPALIGHLTSGYDFVADRAANGASLNQSSASFLDQSSAGFLDQSSAAFLDQSTAAFLDQSTASFLDQSSASFLDASNPAHGHATFCAGILAALAPNAMIMPLRAFDDNGNADAFTIARAILYAVSNGADVINMSFGMASSSQAVQAAIQIATNKGIVVVASAGNDNSSTPQFPASLNTVLGVAATDLNDKKAAFSNYGNDIFVDAPGVNIISAYPGGYYAIASGTSFSAPFVSAEAALLLSESRRNPDNPMANGAVNIDAQNPGFKNELGTGRIDMLQAVENVR
ncbi:MAG TPA: S8 family serine peptidase [Terriglobia bacterium]|jgi:subtilisin family serine protease